jgi:hypothetical protein
MKMRGLLLLLLVAVPAAWGGGAKPHRQPALVADVEGEVPCHHQNDVRLLPSGAQVTLVQNQDGIDQLLLFGGAAVAIAEQDQA